MSEPKKLKNKSFEEIAKMAMALNENMIANRSRSKEQRLNKDKFLRQKFNVSGKDFGATYRDHGIIYDETTFLYIIPERNAKVMQTKSVADSKELIAASTEHHNSNARKEVLPKSIENTGRIEALLLQLIDMMKDKETKIESSGNDLSTKITELVSKNKKDDIKSHCNKVYEPIYKEFKKVCDSYEEFLNQDLFSLALLEFIQKYKKE